MNFSTIFGRFRIVPVHLTVFFGRTSETWLKKAESTYIIHGPPPPQPLLKMSLGQLVYDSLSKNPNEHPAMVDAVTKETISYKEILRKTCSLAESLTRSGYGKNAIISVCSKNSLQFYIPVIAALYIGAIVTTINSNYQEFESVHVLNICKPRIVFCSKEVCRRYVGLKEKLTYIEKIIVIDSDEEVQGAETMNNFINKAMEGQGMLDKFPLAQFDPDEQICFVLYSSGTTGLPKGVMLSHTNVMVRYMHTLDPRYITPPDIFLGVLPFVHSYGLITNFYALVENQMIVVIEKFEENLFLQTIQDYKISILWLAPSLVLLLAKSPLVEKYDLSHVKEVTSAGEILSKENEEAVKKRLKIDFIRQGYGLTEATLGVIMMPTTDRRHGSCGKVATYMSCKVRDPETGKSLGPGQVGELCFKGPMIMKGYYGNEEATRNSFTSDGWLLTGDLGYYDEEEYFYIVDRMKERIKYKAHEVSPAELEALLLSHPEVKEAGVVGIPNEDAGELPMAFIVKNPDAHVTEKEIIDYVAERMSPQKWLRGGVVFVPALPRNAVGKIRRKELKQMMLNFHSKK